MQGKFNDHELIQSELIKLKSSIGSSEAEEHNENVFKWFDLVRGRGGKAMLIGIVIASISQLCGCFAMLQYTENIFQDAGSSMSPAVSAIVVAAILVLGSSFSTFLVDRAGRKVSI